MRQMNISLAEFIDILFDKEKQNEFIKTCEEMGIAIGKPKGTESE